MRTKFDAGAGRGSARLVLLGEPFHRARGPCGFGRLRFVLFLDRFRPLAHPLIVALALHSGVEHLQSSAAGIDLVVMSEIGEAFEDAEQLLVPGASPDLPMLTRGSALRAWVFSS